jgi:hypothetical protein
MRSKPAGRFLLVAIASASCPLLLTAYREGPVPGVTGGFGEPTCQKCHFDNALNAPGGSLHLEGMPDTYVPGHEYRLSVVIRRPELKRGGFEMSARFAEDGGGASAGDQAGRFRASDARAQIVSDPGKAIEYIQHTKTGSLSPRSGQQRWTFAWVAPLNGRSVRFDLAGNAANDDASPLGDFIYATSLSTRPRAGR